MPRGPRTIQRKLIVAIMGTSITVLGITCTVFITYEYVSFRRNILRGLATRGEIIAVNSTAALAFRNEEDATSVLSAFRMDSHVVAACLYDLDGRVFAKYPADAPAESFPTAPMPGRSRFEGAHAVAFLPVAQGDRQLGTVFLRSDLSAMSERFRLYSALVIFAVASSLVVAFKLSHRLQKRVSEPILDLTRTARRVSEQKDYALRARKHSADEVGQLTDSFNDMLAQIQERDSALRRADEEVRELNVGLEERVVERTMQLGAANKELEAFAYSVSHDLRAPLRAINGFSQVLLDRYADRLDGDGKRYLAHVRESAHQMGELIDDLLNLSRVTRAELRREPVDLSELARSVLERLRKSQPERQVDLVVQDDMVAHADPRLLDIVLTNLLGNAWKFSGKRALARIECALKADEQRPVYFVRDNGAGFDGRYGDKLFGVFQRLHSAHEFEGTGIGLATVQRIVQRHGGRVWAEGEVDRGATFYFTLEEGHI